MAESGGMSPLPHISHHSASLIPDLPSVPEYAGAGGRTLWNFSPHPPTCKDLSEEQALQAVIS